MKYFLSLIDVRFPNILLHANICQLVIFMDDLIAGDLISLINSRYDKH